MADEPLGDVLRRRRRDADHADLGADAAEGGGHLREGEHGVAAHLRPGLRRVRIEDRVDAEPALCELVHEFNPNIQTVAVNRGNGNGVESMHPLDACEAIKEAVAKAMKGDIKKCLPKMPKKFEIAITYREHHAARRYSFYPGAEQVDSRTILYKTADYYEAMRFMHFCL